MKTRIVLLLSLVLNISLAATWFFTNRTTSKPAEQSPVPAQKSSSRSETKQRAARVITEVKTEDFSWGKVESDDYRQYIANLRAIGCPEETVRDIIITDINKLYAAKIAALYPSPKDFKFWQTRTRESRDTQREREGKVRELEKEKSDLVKELLGVELDNEMAKQNGEPDQDAWRLGWLSPEKQEQVKALYDKYRAQERAAFTNGNGWDPQNRAKFLALRAQREAELAQLLTPEEFQEYELRNSRTARDMRDTLATFSPSEDEFKKIFELKKSFDDQFAYQRGGGDDTVRQQRDEAQQKLDEQLRAMLGDERYKQYEMAQDDNYRNLYDMMQRANLPTKDAETIYDVRKLAEGEKQRIENDKSLRPDERIALLAALAAQTQTSLSQALGQDFDKYRKAGGGGWLDRLAPSQNNNSNNDQGRRDRGRGGRGPR